MSLQWAKVFFGFPLTDEEIAEVPFPKTELGVHVTYKTVESGTFLGSVIIGPLYTLIRRQTKVPSALRRNFTRFGTYGIGLGLVAGPLMTAARCMNQETPAIYDRDYRLRYNRGQLNVYRAVTAGALICPLLLRFGFRMNLILGIDAGLVAGTLLNRYIAQLGL